MKKAPTEPLDGQLDEMPDEYAFTADEVRNAPRGEFADRYARGTNVVLLDPDAADAFPDSAAVNHALHALASIIREREQAPAA